MFTGIVTHLGKVANKSDNSLIIKTDKQLINSLSKGASIAIDGVCLTVVNKSKDSFNVDYMPETEKKTNIKYLRIGSLVDLELSARPDTFLAGHIVQGHVDGLAKLVGIKEEGNSRVLKFSISPALSKYIVEKGSIALNGVSLTVVEASKDYFTVGIIPHTWEKTMLHTIKLEDHFNIEVDILAKYVEKLMKI